MTHARKDRELDAVPESDRSDAFLIDTGVPLGDGCNVSALIGSPMADHRGTPRLRRSMSLKLKREMKKR